MNQTQAIAKLRKLLGKDAGYRVNPKAPDAEEREALAAQYLTAKAAAKAASEARKARYDELLAGDALYQQLNAAAKAAARTEEVLAGRRYSYRISAGVQGAMFFSIKAQGDNWAEVIAKLEGAT